MKRRALVIAVILLSTLGPLRAQVVHISASGRDAVGVFVANQSDDTPCRILSVKHTFCASDITCLKGEALGATAAINASGTTFEAEVEREALNGDWVILKPKKKTICPRTPVYSPASNIQSILSGDPAAFLRVSNRDGSEQSVRVAITEINNTTVETRPEERVSPDVVAGSSGSPLIVRGSEIVGILVGRCTLSGCKTNTVLRLDGFSVEMAGFLGIVGKFNPPGRLARIDGVHLHWNEERDFKDTTVSAMYTDFRKSGDVQQAQVTFRSYDGSVAHYPLWIELNQPTTFKPGQREFTVTMKEISSTFLPAGFPDAVTIEAIEVSNPQ
jgi:hypothetical protein